MIEKIDRFYKEDVTSLSLFLIILVFTLPDFVPYILVVTGLLTVFGTVFYASQRQWFSTAIQLFGAIISIGYFFFPHH